MVACGNRLRELKRSLSLDRERKVSHRSGDPSRASGRPLQRGRSRSRAEGDRHPSLVALILASVPALRYLRSVPSTEPRYYFHRRSAHPPPRRDSIVSPIRLPPMPEKLWSFSRIPLPLAVDCMDSRRPAQRPDRGDSMVCSLGPMSGRGILHSIEHPSGALAAATTESLPDTPSLGPDTMESLDPGPAPSARDSMVTGFCPVPSRARP